MQHIIKSDNLSNDTEQVITQINHDKLFILTDENTANHCFPRIAAIEPIRHAVRIVIPSGDSNKTMENLARIWQILTEKGATRHALLINLGGGMITDIGGFAAATFKRGIPYINIPTTLLGAVDASIGGKTGINFGGYKNEIGAFYPAEYTIISSDFFHSLSKPDMLSGFAEMIKHALIDSQNHWEELLSFDLNALNYEEMNEWVFHSVSIKENIVNQDPYERNIRKALNLGHTIGHAFESFAIESGKPVLHGYAIAWGLIAELYLSHRICGFPKEKLQKTSRFIYENYQAFSFDCNDYEALCQIMTHDKKNRGSNIHFTLLNDIGDIVIDRQVEKELVLQALDFYRDAVGI